MATDPFGFFVSRGWTPEQSAGIVGNLFGESGLNPNAVGDAGRAYGIAQWHPDRQADFQRRYGVPIRQSTMQQQLDFVNHELTQGKEQRAGNILRNTSNVYDATVAVGKYYERPADLSSSIENRLKGAYDAVKGSLPSSWGEAGTMAKDAALTALDKALENVPFVGAIWKGSKEAGIPNIFDAAKGECGLNPICHLRKWIEESGFVRRMAIATVAIILIIAGVFFLKGNVTKGVLPNVNL